MFALISTTEGGFPDAKSANTKSVRHSTSFCLAFGNPLRGITDSGNLSAIAPTPKIQAMACKRTGPLLANRIVSTSSVSGHTQLSWKNPMTIYDIVPDAEVLLSLETEEAARIVLQFLNSLPPGESGKLNRYNFGLDDTVKEYPSDLRKEEYAEGGMSFEVVMRF